MAPNYSISQKGKRTVIIRTQSQDKCHVSVILTIIANGGKLPPYLIFKGQPNGKIIRELNIIFLIIFSSHLLFIFPSFIIEIILIFRKIQ